MNGAAPSVATPSQTAGPFFHVGLEPHPGGHSGERIRLKVRITDGDGQPVDDALIELWHTAQGAAPPADSQASARFARLPTGGDGSCEFDMVRPGRAADGQAAHINMCLFARGLLRQLHTRIYFEGDPDFESDMVVALVPENRRATLLARPEQEAPGCWVFAVRLQEPNETVFFDL